MKVSGAVTLALFCVCIAGVIEAAPHDDHITEVLRRNSGRSSPEDQASAVMDLLKRLLPDDADQFMVEIDPSLAVDGLDTASVQSPVSGGDEDKVLVRGNNGVAASWGALHFLKYSCNCHISWEADQLNFPATLPTANFTITSKDKVRYYQNVCTASYSSVWWHWPRWEREIDWMALNGINLPLAFTAQESIWRRVYLKMGLTDEELQEFFSGPAFFAWQRMGNLMAWGGPLPTTWHNASEVLQNKILRRMRELGITPVLPCFSGHVPGALTRLYPKANITRMSRWQGFNDSYSRTFMLEFSDPMFSKLGGLFMSEMQEVYGSIDGIYNCDPFNEQTPSTNSSEYMTQVGQSIFNGMTTVDQDAIWLIQGWFLESGFWDGGAAKPLFQSVPQGRMLALDLAGGDRTVWYTHDSFYGQPFAFCMLHNYGGNDGLDGYTFRLTQNLKMARSSPNSTIVGSGISMEGINQNYVIYDFMMELAWMDTLTPQQVIDWAEEYSTRRYGTDEVKEAWRYLMLNVYNNTQPGIGYHGFHVIVKRPQLDAHLTIWYPIEELISAWDIMVDKSNQSLAASLLKKTVQKKLLLLSENTAAWELITTYASHSEVLQMLIKDVKIQKPITSYQNHYEGDHLNGDLSDNYVHENDIIGDRLQDGSDPNELDPNMNLIEDIKANNLRTEQMVKDILHDLTSLESMIGLLELNDQLTFQHDLIDVTREVLQDLGSVVVENMAAAFNNTSYQDVLNNGSYLVELLTDLDDLLNTNQAFQLGNWTESAKLMATNDEEKELFVYNALNQVSLWGPYPAGNLDYACKQWSGLMSNYYLPRWEVFISTLLSCIIEDDAYNQTVVDTKVLTDVERPFTYNTNVTYPNEPIGDTVATVLKLYKKYRPAFTDAGKFVLRTVTEESIETLDDTISSGVEK